MGQIMSQSGVLSLAMCLARRFNSSRVHFFLCARASGSLIHLPLILIFTASTWLEGENWRGARRERADRLGWRSLSDSSSSSSSVSSPSSSSSAVSSSSSSSSSALSSSSSWEKVVDSGDLGLMWEAFRIWILFFFPVSFLILYTCVPLLSMTTAGSHLGANFLFRSFCTILSTQIGSPAR